MDVERPFTDDIFLTLDSKIKFAHLCEPKLGSSGKLLTWVLES
nr:hypothetical protein [Halostagnicola kamekurae]